MTAAPDPTYDGRVYRPRLSPARVKAEPFMTVDEVKDILRVSRMTVYRLVEQELITAFKIGRSIRIPESAVETYLGSARVVWGEESE